MRKGKIISGTLPGIFLLLLVANAACAAADQAVPVTTPAAKPARDPSPGWGFVLRGGYFGVPDYIADDIFRQHPKITGSVGGGEIRYHGEGGARGVASLGLAVDYATAEADGIWQKGRQDEPVAAGGDFEMTAVTLTGYWNVFPSWFLHPYLGLGVGAAYVKGSYHKDNELVTVDAWFPALHVPLGLALELGDHAQLSAEVRVIDGISWGGAFQFRF